MFQGCEQLLTGNMIPDRVKMDSTRLWNYCYGMSVSALEFVKKDIDEFKLTMHSDSQSIACNVRSKLNQETATAAGEKVKHGMSILLDGIKTALIIPHEDMDEDEAEPITISTSEHIFDRAKARVHAIQIDPGTYCSDPSGSMEDFEAWKSTCDLESKKGEISELLVSHVEVRALYTQMVPLMVSHCDFWQRYLYKMYQLECEDQRRADLMKRADVEKQDDLAWDDEDDWENMDSSSPNRKVAPDASQEVKPSLPPTTDKHSTDEETKDTPTDAKTESATEDTTTLSSTTESSSHDVTKDLSVETLTIVTAETPSEEAAEDRLAGGTEVDGCPHDQQAADSLKTKEKGDLIVVGEQTSSERTSPSSSDNSHNKESLDEDWEKDFDIEVTEEDLKQAHQEAKALSPRSKENEDDWESWE